MTDEEKFEIPVITLKEISELTEAGLFEPCWKEILEIAGISGPRYLGTIKVMEAIKIVHRHYLHFKEASSL